MRSINYLFSVGEAVGRKIVEKRRKPLKGQGKLGNVPLWKAEEIVHVFPQEGGRFLFSTGCVQNVLFELWKTWGKMLK